MAAQKHIMTKDDISDSKKTQSLHLCRIPCRCLPLICEADSGFTPRPVVHCDRTADFNVLIYLKAGKMEIIEDHTVYTLTPGTLFFLKHHVHHWGISPFEKNTSWLYVHFYTDDISPDMPELEPSKVLPLRRDLPESYYDRYIRLPKIVRFSDNSAVPEMLENIITLFNARSNRDAFTANIRLMDFFIHCSSLSVGSHSPAGHADAVMRFIETHACRSFAAEELEKAVGLSYKYAGTLFKNTFGTTIREYQHTLRIKLACRLLLETDMPVSLIAEKTGYYDSFHFSRVFKQFKGTSPQNYRKTSAPNI